MSEEANKTNETPNETPSETPKRETAADRAWAVRRARIRRIMRNFVTMVGLPTLLAIIYYGFWAADEYVSVSVVTVQSPPEGQEKLGGSFVSNRPDDSRLARKTMRSRAALLALAESQKWRDHYANNGNMFSSLDADAGSEEAYTYFLERTTAKADKGQSITLRVRAFSAQAAATFSKELLSIAEARLNEVALRPLHEQAKVAAARIDKAKTKLSKLSGAALPLTADQAESAELKEARTALADAEALAEKIDNALLARTRYLTMVSGPSIPTDAQYPKRLWSIATVFVIAFALMGVLSLLLGAVREHAKV